MATESEEIICIPMKEYNQLVKDSDFLARLHAAGVDNWDWYSEALEQDDDE